MLIRYFLWLAVALAAVFLVIASASFTSLAAIASPTFGISICTLVVSVGIASATGIICRPCLPRS
jgi:hypothetical protein